VTVTVSSFRTDFPEFKDNVKYPDSGINYYLTLALTMLVNPLRWGTVYDNGVELFIAHNLVLESQAQSSAKTGASPGLQTGAISGKSVGPVSVSYDASAGLEPEASHWNLTVYGTRFLNLARMVGAGGLQV
jgi:hypothetical protein